MTLISRAFAVLACVLLASAAGAQAKKLQPANPQPSGLKTGLAVGYAWAGDIPAKIDFLQQAKDLLKDGIKAGKPLRGLDYRDTDEGDPVLTFDQPYNVAAVIQGYIRFDAPGTYEVETWSNDGIEAFIGGQKVGIVTGRQTCSPNQRTAVEVPQAGWYDLNMVYFQKWATSCLMMKWGNEGDEDLKWVPNDVFGYK
ncbi:MAG: PA14 domain-containing protein [Paracoccaceae bacterium]